MSDFVAIARKSFSFLEDDYGFKVKRYGGPKGDGFISYFNAQPGVGVKLEYEVRSGFVFVWIYKLVDGEMRENLFPVTENSQITKFDFNDALPESEKMRASYEYEETSPYFDEKTGLIAFVDDFAARLRKHGRDILSGDFSILPEVEKKIKKRAGVK